MSKKNRHIHSNSDIKFCNTPFLIPSYKDLVFAYNHPDENIEILCDTSEKILFTVRFPKKNKEVISVSDIYNIAIKLESNLCKHDSNHARNDWLNAVRGELGFVITIRRNLSDDFIRNFI